MNSLDAWFALAAPGLLFAVIAAVDWALEVLEGPR